MAQGIHGSAQQRHVIGNDTENPVCGLAAKLRPAICLDYTALRNVVARAQPKAGLTIFPHCSCQCHGETGGGRCVFGLYRMDFMHPTIGEPASKRRIKRGNAAGPANSANGRRMPGYKR